MRDFSKALENIRKTMRAQDEEFRRAEGLMPRDKKPEPKIPSLLPEPKPQDPQKASGENLDPNRFLLQSQDTAPEIVEVIPQKDSRHSWLYNEVAKAVQNASDGNPNTKVVAVFVPVVQSGHELENLPVHETVELPPVHEEDFRIEDEIDIQNDPVPAESEPDETDNFVLDESKPEIPEENDFSEGEPSQPEDTVNSESEPQESEEPAESQESIPAESEPQESAEPELPEELSAEPEQAEHLDELVPESIEHPDPALAKAFSTIEEKLDESFSAEQEQPETEDTAEITENAAENSEMVSEFSAVDMSEFDITEGDDYSEGEKMSFTENPPDDDGEKLPELDLPDALEDDEIIIDDIDESSEDSKAN